MIKPANTLPEHIWDELSFDADTCAGLKAVTRAYFLIYLPSDLDVPAAVMGIMPRDLFPPEAYVWFRQMPWARPKLAELRRVIREGQKLINVLPHYYFGVYAEIEPDDSVARKFAEAFGFYELGPHHGRIIMQLEE